MFLRTLVKSLKRTICPIPRKESTVPVIRAASGVEIGMPYSSLAIANEFLERSLLSERPTTAMHLQKFCYLAHGFSLALLDRALTIDKPEAWAYGPVYSQLYDVLKAHGSSPIPHLIRARNWEVEPRARGDVIRAKLNDAEKQLVDTVWADYGTFHAFQLSALTHKDDSPWAKVYRPGELHIRIPDEEIKGYFLGLTGQPAVVPNPG